MRQRDPAVRSRKFKQLPSGLMGLYSTSSRLALKEHLLKEKMYISREKKRSEKSRCLLREKNRSQRWKRFEQPRG